MIILSTHHNDQRSFMFLHFLSNRRYRQSQFIAFEQDRIRNIDAVRERSSGKSKTNRFFSTAYSQAKRRIAYSSAGRTSIGSTPSVLFTDGSWAKPHRSRSSWAHIRGQCSRFNPLTDNGSIPYKKITLAYFTGSNDISSPHQCSREVHTIHTEAGASLFRLHWRHMLAESRTSRCSFEKFNRNRNAVFDIHIWKNPGSLLRPLKLVRISAHLEGQKIEECIRWNQIPITDLAIARGLPRRRITGKRYCPEVMYPRDEIIYAVGRRLKTGTS